MGITLTERGRAKLAELLGEAPPPALRIYLADSGCGGDRLCMTPEGNPDVPEALAGQSQTCRFQDEDFTFFMDKNLSQRTGNISIDFTRGIFNLVSNMGQSCVDGCGACGLNLILRRK